MAYDDFLKNINEKFQALFTEISAEYNFDNGLEFEIALCKAFRIILPIKFGICRGFVVSKQGDKAGDDIIIYDQERYPTLRLLEDNTFAQKQKVPVEAVYAYIEAKHTLYLEGDGGQSLQKSLNQIKAVKSIPREKVPMTQITPQTSILSYQANRPAYWPNYRNPLYTAIISRNVCINTTDKSSDIATIHNNMRGRCILLSQETNIPDLIIASSNIVAIPSVGTQIESPFFMEGKSLLIAFKAFGEAFGIGLTNMMYAFDHIALGCIHWPTVLAEALKLELKNEE